ncbi:hypothetical protein C0584_00820 [Candidatus Parcubacteria bacterium]|nr:MAG: hypothetical protein C0584_00820 [Candidatus Parcubacteria bacterium]
MTTLIKTIKADEQDKRSWTVELNGKRLEEVETVRIFNENFGELNYGMTIPGYDGISFHENSGGGVVCVPFVVIDGRLYIGMVQQERHNQGGKVWNLPRGFIDPGENHFEAMAREFEEEIRYSSPDKMVKPLSGDPCNPNSAFFETPNKNEGVKFFSIEVLPKQLELESISGGFRFRSGILKPLTKAAEQIYSCRFFPWRETSCSSDMFTVAGIARLLSSQFISL